MQVSLLDINHPVASSLWNEISIHQLTLLLPFWTDASKTLLFLLKNDYYVVTNISRLYFSTGVGWCLFWLVSHCIIYTVHASSWQNSQLNQNNSPDVCRNLLCTLHLASTAHSFSPHAPQHHLLLIFITNIKFRYLLFKKLWILKLSIPWQVVGHGCHGRLSRHVQWLALHTGSSVLPTHENPSGCHPIPRVLQASFSSPLDLYPPTSQELLLISTEGSEGGIRMFV